MNRQKWKIPVSQKNALKNQLKVTFPEAKQEAEQYCDYRLKIPVGPKQSIIAKQYDNGTFYAEGPSSPKWYALCDMVNRVSPSSTSQQPTTKSLLGSKAQTAQVNVEFLSHNYIGQDESGKGDYFGGPVVAGVYLMPIQAKTLQKAGIQDSKDLGAKQITEAAKRITDIIPASAIEIISTPPDVYNAMYETFKQQGKNLNNLLGHLHATILRRLIDRNSNCEHAIIDQFGKTSDVTDYLSLPNTFQLIQQPKAEMYTAVAAASILAREAFVQQIKTLEEKYQYRFPLGASSEVVTAARNFKNRYGEAALANVAKLHFKTTDSL